MEFDNNSFQQPNRTNPSPDYNRRRKNNNQTKAIVACVSIGVVLLVLIAVAVFAGSAIKNYFLKSFMSPDDYFKHVQEENIEDFSDGIGSLFDLMADLPSRYDVITDTTLTFGEAGKDMVGNLVDDTVAPYINQVNNIRIRSNPGISGDIVGTELSLSANDIEIATANIDADTQNGYAYITLPELIKSSLRIPMNQSDSFAGILDSSAALPEGDDVEDVIEHYSTLALSEIKDVTKSSEIVNVGDMSKECTLLTATIDSATATAIAKAVLTDAQKDSKLKSIISSMVRSCGYTGDFESDYDTYINDALNKVNTEGITMSENIYIDVWTDGKGNIIGNGVRSSEASFVIKTLKKGLSSKSSFDITLPEADISVMSSAKLNGTKIDSDHTLTINGLEICTVYTTDADLKNLLKGKIGTKIKVEMSDAVSGMLSTFDIGSEITSLIENSALEVSVSSDSFDKIGTTVALYSEDKLVISLNTTSQKGSTYVPRIPTDYMDSSEADAWLQSIDISKLFGLLMRFGNNGGGGLFGAFPIG